MPRAYRKVAIILRRLHNEEKQKLEECYEKIRQEMIKLNIILLNCSRDLLNDKPTISLEVFCDFQSFIELATFCCSLGKTTYNPVQQEVQSKEVKSCQKLIVIMKD